MGNEWIAEVIDILQRDGFRTQRGYPVEKIPYLTEPVVAVYIDYAFPRAIELVAHVFSPMKGGGVQCEDATMKAAQALFREGIMSYPKNCVFDPALGLFSQRIQIRRAETIETV